MAELTRDDVLHVARLSALELTEQEAEALCAELRAVLSYMQELDALDVAEVEPTAHPFALGLSPRPDTIVESLPRETYLDAAPATEAGGFAVPKVLDGDP